MEVASAPALLVLHRLPRWLVPVILGVLLVVGLAVSGPWRWLGALALLIVGAFIGWLTALSWPLLSGTARLARVAVCGAVVGVAVLKALGRF
ncbi:MAG: hypothetical protein EPO13_09340 [Actinomycetota bacterium]|nr:MAG: hypothetical protein EPO13_09340 [Actinomycetota bacterium]